ncbi:hypothetical protein [Neobacillus terrae]|uniref:hypothetical protein n=1 Tax=Neobacillus terrae TaxID=3034837 RepID=UPI00140E0177|nr:hypothetical protein [Neobacillus terrae]NHM30848.1 hypothetical protein [Neobacillus terrae]
MFYNGEGDECGGLIFGSWKDEKGNYESTASLTFDQYKQDQVVQMSYTENNGERDYGFSIYDRPAKPLPEIIEKDKELQESSLSREEKDLELDKLWEGNTSRAFMGKNQNGEVIVQLSDSKGKP